MNTNMTGSCFLVFLTKVASALEGLNACLKIGWGLLRLRIGFTHFTGGSSLTYLGSKAITHPGGALGYLGGRIRSLN